MAEAIFDAQYWNNRYDQQQTGWDIGYVSDPLKAYFDQLKDKSVRILIPGCGNSYEAAYLLEQGFTNITVIDIAPALTIRLQKKLAGWNGKELTIVTGDFFEMVGEYDLIIEQTFFCALDPDLRAAYVQKMASLLKHGGKLTGVLFNQEFEGGPPFGGNKDEYQNLFSQYFTIDTLAPCNNSIPPRMGTELFMILTRE